MPVQFISIRQKNRSPFTQQQDGKCSQYNIYSGRILQASDSKQFSEQAMFLEEQITIFIFSWTAV